MAKYKVLRPIEHSFKLYLPEAGAVPEGVRSFGNGGEILVDRSGVIELSEAEAAQMSEGQIEPMKEKAKVEGRKSKE
jgi:hypothetical protein